MSGQDRKQLCLKRGPWTSSVKISNERVVGLVENDCRVESSAKMLGERLLPDTYRTLDGNVTEVQYTRQYNSQRFK